MIIVLCHCQAFTKDRQTHTSQNHFATDIHESESSTEPLGRSPVTRQSWGPDCDSDSVTGRAVAADPSYHCRRLGVPHYELNPEPDSDMSQDAGVSPARVDRHGDERIVRATGMCSHDSASAIVPE